MNAQESERRSSDEELANRSAKRYIAGAKSGFPDRIEMRDAGAVMPPASRARENAAADRPIAHIWSIL
jgi:hypothetical protein